MNPRILQVAKDSAMIGLTVVAIENWFWNWLKNFTPDDIYIAIEKNESLKLDQGTLDWLKPLYGNIQESFQKFTPEYILSRARVKRPDLWAVFTTHPRGAAWLGEKISEIKQQISP